MNQKMRDKSCCCYKQRLWTLMGDWLNSIQTERITVLHMFYAMLCKYCIKYFLFYFSSQCTLQLIPISTSYPPTHPWQITNVSCSTFLSNVWSHLAHYMIPSLTPRSKPYYMVSPRPQHGNRIKGSHLQLWTNLQYRRNSELLIAMTL